MTATTEDLFAQLEADYRRLLRWYPKPWRQAHGDALIGTLMDEADAKDRFLVEPGEWRSFAAAGITARLDRIVMRNVRDTAAAIALALGLATSIPQFVYASWQPSWSDAPRSFGPFFNASPVLTVLWVIAAVAALAGKWWVGRVTLVLSAVVALSLKPVEQLIAAPHFFSLDPATVTFSVACALLATLGTPRTGRRLLGTIAAGAGLTLVALVATYVPSDTGIAGDWRFRSPMQWFYVSEYPAALILLALTAAVVLGVMRHWTAAFIVLLSTVPFAATLDVAAGSMLNVLTNRAVNPWAVSLAIVLGLAVLIAASSGTLRLPARQARDGASPIS